VGGWEKFQKQKRKKKKNRVWGEEKIKLQILIRGGGCSHNLIIIIIIIRSYLIGPSPIFLT